MNTGCKQAHMHTATKICLDIINLLENINKFVGMEEKAESMSTATIILFMAAI